MEWSYGNELEKLKLGEGELFQGEAILAVAKALLQSGISYVGGYQGSPVAYLLDTLADGREILKQHGVHFQWSASEASAAAMLGASITYPIRGVAIFKSVAGTAVASDALSNLSSAGVRGGAMVILGSDYGEKGNVGQERTQASAMKSSMWLLEPRPHLPIIVRMVEQGFELSEASHTPVILELRLRMTHASGEFVCKDNRRAGVPPELAAEPVYDFSRLVLPPANYEQERHKVEVRYPIAERFIRERGLNESFDGERDDIGIITVGGLYNSVAAGLRDLGLADIFGQSEVPILCLNVTYPIVADEIADFCRGKRAVLIVEESFPDFIAQAVSSLLRRAGIDTTVVGKEVLPKSGQYTEAVLLRGLARFLEGAVPQGMDLHDILRRTDALLPESPAVDGFGDALPAHDATFCTGCPERPMFSAMKLLEREIGPVHVAADIGCHTYCTGEPFNLGQTILGYGLSLASASAVGQVSGKRVISVMGDGGFWHNGLTTGVANAVVNNDDGVLVVLDNRYTASTGGQSIPSSEKDGHEYSAGMDIEQAVRALGVRWVRRVESYGVARLVATLRKAMRTKQTGLKVIVVDGECQLVRQRRLLPARRRSLSNGERNVRTRFGVDASLCTGDHSCIRLSGCPSLTVKDNPDPLKDDPIVQVDNGCVGCGLCGEVAHAAALCPSFYRAEIIENPTSWDRFWYGFRQRIMDPLRPADS